MLALFQTANAEEQLILDAIDLHPLEEYAAEQDFDFIQWTLSILSGDADFSDHFTSLLNQCKNVFLSESRSAITAVIIPAVILLPLRLLLPSGASAQRAAAFVCRLSCIAALFSVFTRMQTIAVGLMQEFVLFSNAVTPVLIAAVSLSGAETAAAFLNPMTALCANLIQGFLSEWGIALSSAAAGIAVAGNMSIHVSLKRLHELLKRILHWGTGGLLAAFMAVLSLQGRLSAGRDSAAARTAKYAIESLIPVIGGNVSDSLDSLLSTAAVIRNALGVSGLMLLVCVCIVPMARLLGMVILLRLSSAIVEPLGDDALAAFAGQFAESVEMLLILCTAGAVLCALLIGSCMNVVAGTIR